MAKINTKTIRYLVCAACLWVTLPVQAQVETVTINFRNTEIDAVIESIAELTGRTFIVDPRVKGRMSIVSPEPIKSELLYEVFLSALQVHGYQAIDDGAAVRVIPQAQAISVPQGKTGGEFITEVIALQHVEAGKVIPMLKPILTRGSHLAADASNNMLIVIDTEAQISRIKNILGDLDNPDNAAFEIIPIRYGTAQEIVSVAKEMGMLNNQTKILEDPSGTRIIISGPRPTRDRLRGLVRALDVESEEKSGFAVVHLNYADAEKMQPILASMLQSPAFLQVTGEKKNDKKTNYAVQADKENNALIIAASAGVSQAIVGIIKKLDRPRSQVLIEAVIAEVSETFVERFGVDFGIISAAHGGLLSDFSGKLAGIAQAIEGEDLSAAPSITGTPIAGAGGYLNGAKTFGLAAIIEAVNTDTASRLLSTPSILTLENEDALISVGQEVPFATGTYTTTANGASNPFQTIERKEVGTILKVTPQINEGNTVRLKIKQEVSDVAASAVEGGIGVNNVTNKKVIETNVIVDNEETLVLGGLIDNRIGDSESKVPVLGDLPLLGFMFRSTSQNETQKTLMIFIRPTIVRDPKDARKVSQERYQVLYGDHAEFMERNEYQKDLPPVLDELIDAKR